MTCSRFRKDTSQVFQLKTKGSNHEVRALWETSEPPDSRSLLFLPGPQPRNCPKISTWFCMLSPWQDTEAEVSLGGLCSSHSSSEYAFMPAKSQPNLPTTLWKLFALERHLHWCYRLSTAYLGQGPSWLDLWPSACHSYLSIEVTAVPLSKGWEPPEFTDVKHINGAS